MNPYRHAKSVWSNSRGSALLIVLGIAGAACIIWGGLNSMKQLSSKQMFFLDSKIGSQMLRQDIRMQLSRSTTCIQAVESKDNFPVDATGNVDPKTQFDLSVRLTPKLVAAGGFDLSRYSVRVNRLFLYNLYRAGISGAGNPIYVGEVYIEPKALKGVDVSFETASVGKLYVEVETASKKIKSCFNAEDPRDIVTLTCSQMGGNYNQATGVCQVRGPASDVTCKLADRALPSGQWATDVIASFDPKEAVGMVAGVPVADGPVHDDFKKAQIASATHIASKSFPGGAVHCYAGQGKSRPQPYVYIKKCDYYCAGGRLLSENCRANYLGLELGYSCPAAQVRRPAEANLVPVSSLAPQAPATAPASPASPPKENAKEPEAEKDASSPKP